MGGLVNAVTRRPLAGAGRHGVAGARGRGARAASRAERRHRHPGGPRLRELRGDRALQAGLRRRGGAGARQGRAHPDRAHERSQAACCGSRAACRATSRTPRRGSAACRRCAARSRRSSRPRSVYGPAHVRQHGSRADPGRVRQAPAGRGAQAREAAEAARRLSRSRGDPRAEQERLARAAADAVQAQFVNEAFRLALRYGLTGIPRINDPNFVSTLVFDSSSAGRAEVALRLPVPVEERRPDPDPDAARPDGCRTPQARSS